MKEILITSMNSFIYPVIAVLTGLLAGAAWILGFLPFFKGLVERLIPFRTPLGFSGMIMALIILVPPFFEYSPIILIGAFSLFLTGFSLVLDFFIHHSHSRKENLWVLWAAQVIQRLRPLLGILTIVTVFVRLLFFPG